MDTPEHERRAVEDYLRSQSGQKFKVKHVEKLTSEYVLGHQYDVWDAHTNEGRWWVITNPTNLYSQKLIKSMDIALSFHIGLMTRMMATESRHFNSADGTDRWVLEVLRRLDLASEALDRAKEVEDIQAVGMRLREALLTLVAKLRSLDIQLSSDVELPQNANFKAWASVYADLLAPGSSLDRLRALLKTQSERTWEYVNWLTHARNASIVDGRIAWSAANQAIETYLFAVARMQRGGPERCPICASYQLSNELTEDLAWIQRCATCGWLHAVDRPPPSDVRDHDDAQDRQADGPVGDCVVPEDFGIYLTPAQACAMLENSSKSASEDAQPEWVNPFTFMFVEDGSMVDVHRLVFTTFKRRQGHGSEFVYMCHEASCVNPDHAQEEALPEALTWVPAIVERVIIRPEWLELEVSCRSVRKQRIFVEPSVLDRYGYGDASSLVERVVMISDADPGGTVQLLPVERRADNARSSAVTGWMHPKGKVKAVDPCPCGGGAPYSTCHGRIDGS
jgi:hypothetical protein